jgi:cell division protein FtsZ
MKKNIKIKQKTKPVKINSKALVNKKKNKTTKKAVVKKSQAKVLVKKNKKPVSKIVKKNKTTKPRLVSEPIKPIKIDKEIDSSKKIRIKIIGIGGGGSNIVSELSKKLKDFSSQKVDFVAANTDTQALSSLSRNIKTFPFGQKLTRGLGTGRDVGLGERAARDDFEKLKNIFLEDKDLYIVISSLGGGTGTGSAPVFAKAASDLGLSVLGIFTLPFVFEGKKKMDAALDALEKMKENLNAYMVLPNEKIFNLAKE